MSRSIQEIEIALLDGENQLKNVHGKKLTFRHLVNTGFLSEEEAKRAITHRLLQVEVNDILFKLKIAMVMAVCLCIGAITSLCILIAE